MAAHSYWRIYVTANNGDATWTDFNEIEFRATIGGTDQCSGGTALGDDSTYNSPNNAFDNDTANSHISSGGLPSWVGYQFASPVEVAQVSLITPLVNEAARAPKDFLIQYSDDGITWTTAKEVINQTNWTTAEQRLFPIYEGVLTGNITESLSISNWRATATKVKDGTIAGTSISTGTTYSIDCITIEPCLVTVSPKIDYAWSASKIATSGAFVCAVNPDTTQFQFEVTTGGTFGTTEPTWNTTVSGTTTSGTATLTCRGALVDPVTIGPKIPS